MNSGQRQKLPSLSVESPKKSQQIDIILKRLLNLPDKISPSENDERIYSSATALLMFQALGQVTSNEINIFLSAKIKSPFQEIHF